MEVIDEVMKKLTPELRSEVIDFARFLAQKLHKPRQNKLRLNWAGGLREYRNQYTSLELQKKVFEWWGD